MTLSSTPDVIIVRPEDISSRSIMSISDQIIQALIRGDTIDVIGISSAVSVACSSVSRAKELANVNVVHASIDYLELPVVGKFEAIFFRLSRRPAEVPIESVMKQLDSKMNLSFTPEGQAVSVPKRERPERLTSIALSKLQRFPIVKILAAGAAINSGVYVALQVARSGISKQPIAIDLVGLSSVESKFPSVGKVASLEIYLVKGKETKYSDAHKQMLDRVKSGLKS